MYSITVNKIIGEDSDSEDNTKDHQKVRFGFIYSLQFVPESSGDNKPFFFNTFQSISK